jgi:RNA polymerase-interacting CarD/CdnL/TRCF family regulator
MSKESVVSDQRLRNKLKSVFELTQQNPIPWKKINKKMQNLLEEFKTSDLAKVLFLNINCIF